jgi:dephospho-CoA kinase
MADAKIVGIGGMVRSGKDTLAELFIKAGYYGVSFGDILRGFARERHKDKPDPISVANMTETSNWLRETRGADVILQEALRQFNAKQASGDNFKGMVLWSIRAPAEVDWILANGGVLIWVEASEAVRYQRALANLREGETRQTLEEFKRQEALQWKPQPGVPVEAQMDLSYVKSHATRTLDNNDDDKQKFINKANQLIETVNT